MDKQFNLGIDVIDNEHATLFKIGEELKKSLNGETHTDLYLTASRLYEYVLTHLEHEEKLIMEWSGYREHLGQHNRLKFELDNLFERISRPFFIDNTSLLQELHDFVIKWLQIHILKEDVKYVEFLRSKLKE